MAAYYPRGHSIVDRMGRGDIVQCPFPTVTAAFYHHAGTRPAALAVHDMSGQTVRYLTYGQLSGRAQALAARLLSVGVQPGQRVPLVVKRGLEMVVAIWAVLSCGAQYVPLDGGVVPDSTIRQVVEQSDPVVLCLSATRDRVRALCPEVMTIALDEDEDDWTHQDSEPTTGQDSSKPIIDLATSESGCYVIYTSGTTGKPKGVDVTHRNVSNLVCLYPGNLNIGPGTRVGQMLNISFDMAAWEIFSCLCNGGTLVLRGAKWETALQEIDVFITTPTILSKYHPTQYPRIRIVATAGEPTTQSLADLWATHATYWNCCGPTETTIVNTMQKHVPGDGVNIGRPTPNNAVYILDEDLRPVNVGVPGVMWAGGCGVSRGYVGLEAKTRQVYVPDRFSSSPSCMYQTGDVGRWRPDGCIEIIGRVDDQVKVKGFRVELDGISATLACAPGVAQAAALLIDGEIHGFTTPVSHNVSAILAHAQRRQPYYAVPSRVHELEQFPVTNNGKVDKGALRALARGAPPPSITTTTTTTTTTAPLPSSPALAQQQKCDTASLASDSSSDLGTLVEVRSTTSTESTLTAVSEKYQHGYSSDDEHDDKHAYDQDRLNQDIEGKRLPQPLRGLRHRLLIVYRVLFGLVALANAAALLALAATTRTRDVARLFEWLGVLTAANLVAAVLVRQDAVINLVYALACSVPRTAPIWLRARCAKVYHLGGLHSGAAVCATAWLVASTVAATVEKVKQRSGSGSSSSTAAGSMATLVVSWILSGLCVAIVAFSWPSFRKRHHNAFEQIHRFAGWIAVCLFWVRTVLSTMDATPKGQSVGLALAKSPVFWLLSVSTCSIAASWFTLRKVPVVAEPLSEHAVRLTFDYTVPVNGSFTRISTRPLLEWHSFATIPIPKAAPTLTSAPTRTSTALTKTTATTSSQKPGYSLVVSNAGDWTKACIRNPPTKLWVRGLPTCGVMRIATLFNRIVVVATGSGIGPLLGHIQRPTCPTQLIWSASRPEESFGKDMVQTVRRSIPNAVIHDTKVLGRPDLVRMGYNLAKDFGAEAVIVIANEKITKKIVYGLETRGIPAYGAIWDS